MSHTHLDPKKLYRKCNLRQFSFSTTDELEGLTGVIGQERAVKAVEFGLNVRQQGYNLFVLGPPGHGKRSMIEQYLKQKAGTDPVPWDRCYVHNFEHPHQPRELMLPAGQGKRLKKDMEELIAELRAAIPTVFESEEYHTRKQEIEEEFDQKRTKALEDIGREATKHDVAFIRTPIGFAFSPRKDGNVLSAEEFHKLPKKEQEKLKKVIAELEQQLEASLHQIPQWRGERREKLENLNSEVTTFAVGHLMDEFKKGYADTADVLDYLNAVGQDIIKRIDEFRGEEEAPVLPGLPLRESPAFRRYEINLFVDHSESQGAPVVYEDFPSHQNLTGWVEHESRMGTLVTDFTFIKPGALHKANGGYLILEAQKLLMQPFAWEALKRSLTTGQIRIDSVEHLLGLARTQSLEPEPVTLNVKIVLLGDPFLYYLLYQYDHEFNELFRVAADFEEDMDRTPENCRLYARLMAQLAQDRGLHPLDRGAVGRIIEYSSRQAGNAMKLSAHVRDIAELMSEADYWAKQNDRDVISAPDVQQAIDAQTHRADRLRERSEEMVERGMILIDTEGKKVAQVNGLSVIDLGSFMFARPSKITATARVGSGDVVDIEREVKLGGAVHSKGVLILSQFFASRYSKNQPLSLSASLVFEQTYGPVEGDSASLPELCALLSALSEIPIKQSLAVTGSVNQQGHVQAVGAVNEKIEGFFDICRIRGLTGDQGVLIPALNEQHLMLRKDVVDAAVAGQFHIYLVHDVDEALDLLTGQPAGQRDEQGNFPAGTVNHCIEKRLSEFTAIRKRYSEGEGHGELELSTPE